VHPPLVPERKKATGRLAPGNQLVRHITTRRSGTRPKLHNMARDRIPTSRVSRTAKIGGLAAGQAIRQAGTRAVNVARTKEGRDAALERRHIEAAEQIG